MLGRSYAVDARSGTSTDVAEKAGALCLMGTGVDTVGTSPHGKRLEEQVETLTNSPRLGKRTKVGGSRDIAAARHDDAWHVVSEGDGQVGVGLVVGELHVEGRIKLLDPREFKLQRLELRLDDCPRHVGS